MFKKTAIVAGILMSCAAQAEKEDAIVTGDKFVDTYRWEIDASAGRTNIDPGSPFDDGDVDKFGIGGSFFFDDVDTTKGPRREAAFLDHASDISLAYVYTDADDIVEDLDGDKYAVSGRYVLGLDSIPLIFEGAWSRVTPDFSDIDTWSLGFGAYLTDNTTVVLTYETIDVDKGTIDAGDVDIWGIEAKHMWLFDNGGGIELNGQYAFVDVDCNNCDDPDSYGINSTWYVNKDLGFGIGLGKEELGSLETDVFSVTADWFVTRSLGLNLAYQYKEQDKLVGQRDDTEYNTVVLSAAYRF
jgi:predicted porin